MIIWVDKSRTGMPCNQRAEVRKVVDQRIRVRLLGTGDCIIIEPQHIVGIEIDGHLTIMFKWTGHTTKD